MTRTLFKCEEGEQQGAVEIMPLFALGIDTANNLTNDNIIPFGEALVSRVDDTYIIGPPQILFAYLHRHKDQFARLGLSLQLTKTKCYIAGECQSITLSEVISAKVGQ